MISKYIYKTNIKQIKHLIDPGSFYTFTQVIYLNLKCTLNT